ncbi:EAL domain-containing protein [Companilactobacillus allii]|uniref:Diguanylate cyclase n=1 Tax=Companilactobacillus allii TaxID=1847728 RepID=A0A1P8Q0Y7_9LACO|nr:EAL domain-containing protein [Companilactobacillus allii]APX71528.1 diguanylate cyclase [Companilactobacillus allii]USQ68610.1 EAL domain-containing protein [Companilactobacillus allii]
MYRFFAQPQVNEEDKSIFGYELLLRTNENGFWTLPKDFTKISIDDQAALLEVISKKLHTELHDIKLAFNLNQKQASDPFTLGSIIALKKRINPAALTIELTEAPTLEEMKEISFMLHQYKIAIVLDDVGTGSNTYDNVKHLLPYVDQIKFAMQNLRMDGDAEKIPSCLSFWVDLAKKFRLELVLEGVEDKEDQSLAKKFGINIQQGYLYGKPALL